MRTFLLLPCVAALVGCGTATTTYVHTDTTLGRVVVYRNGVAYFERYADVTGDTLRLSVPSDKVNDFLKSLTVTDAVTGEPAPIAYPTTPGGSEAQGGLIGMDIHLSGAAPHRLKLSYVSEAPSWKPSYRVTLGKDGKVGVQAWAIVDNTSGEDWQNVKLGVGSSSAMSFRFDLRSVRTVERETLNAEDMFALAPPTGESTFGDGPGDRRRASSGPHELELADATIAERPLEPAPPAPPPPLSAPAPVADQAAFGRGGARSPAPAQMAAAQSSPPGNTRQAGVQPVEKKKLAAMVAALRASDDRVVIEGYAAPGDADKESSSLARANEVRDELVRAGIDASRVVAHGNGAQAGHAAGVRISREEASKDAAKTAAGEKGDKSAREVAEQPGDPIGTSHFETGSTMTVPHGSSAMVSILHSDTDGEVVYLYDPETARGNAVYPFRAIRIKNPTDSALESGPVSVFGENKFIGEGMCDPIPARSTAFVPFALDRQIVVERKDAERDEIAKILTVQRGVLSTQVQHIRRQTVTLHNRLGEKATVYLRHTVAPGYKLTKSPKLAEHMGNADLFRVDIEPLGKVDVDIEEATPVQRTTDLRSPDGLEMVQAFVSSAAADGPLRAAIAELLQIHRDTSVIEERIKTTREQMQEYRERMDELHGQIMTLKMVKTGGPLMQSLEKKMQEISDKLSKATIDVVALEEKLMISRVHFQDRVAELTLDKQQGGPGDPLDHPTAASDSGRTAAGPRLGLD